MKVVIAVDSFKGSMSSLEAGHAACEGVLRVIPDADVVVKALADGGEGTYETLLDALGGSRETVCVRDALGRSSEASYGILSDGRTAVLEMAEASGIAKISPDELDPHLANTFGFGELMRDAWDKGCREFIIGIGGSATTEAGLGMLGALGLEFCDADGRKLAPVIDEMDRMASIRSSERKSVEELFQAKLSIACDVENPLLGENGAVAVYGPQKGVKKSEIPVLDEKMSHFADLVAAYCGSDYREKPGAGAAGGLGFTLMSFWENATLRSGADIVIDLLDIESEIWDADIVITGEGRIDGQTASGKGPMKIAQLGKRHGAATFGFGGCLGADADRCAEFFDVMEAITPKDMPPEEAMDPETAMGNMADSVEDALSEWLEQQLESSEDEELDAAEYERGVSQSDWLNSYLDAVDELE